MEGEFEIKDGIEDQNVIEKNFFKSSKECKFTDLFHNGGLPNTLLYSNVQEIQKQGEKYGLNICERELTSPELET